MTMDSEERVKLIKELQDMGVSPTKGKGFDALSLTKLKSLVARLKKMFFKK